MKKKTYTNTITIKSDFKSKEDYEKYTAEFSEAISNKGKMAVGFMDSKGKYKFITTK